MNSSSPQDTFVHRIIKKMGSQTTNANDPKISPSGDQQQFQIDKTIFEQRANPRDKLKHIDYRMLNTNRLKSLHNSRKGLSNKTLLGG